MKIKFNDTYETKLNTFKENIQRFNNTIDQIDCMIVLELDYSVEDEIIYKNLFNSRTLINKIEIEDNLQSYTIPVLNQYIVNSISHSIYNSTNTLNITFKLFSE